MKCNIGKTDRTARTILGLVIIIAGLYFRTWWGLIGLVLMLTAYLGLCLLYLPFGISTCDERKNEAAQSQPPTEKNI